MSERNNGQQLTLTLTRRLIPSLHRHEYRSRFRERLASLEESMPSAMTADAILGKRASIESQSSAALDDAEGSPGCRSLQHRYTTLSMRSVSSSMSSVDKYAAMSRKARIPAIHVRVSLAWVHLDTATIDDVIVCDLTLEQSATRSAQPPAATLATASSLLFDSAVSSSAFSSACGSVYAIKRVEQEPTCRVDEVQSGNVASQTKQTHKIQQNSLTQW